MMDMETICAIHPTAVPLTTRSPAGDRVCRHEPQCPSADAPDRLAARIIADHPEQGWALLCNGVITFDDAGVLLSAA